jgi:uncharacterized membrane protein YfcA
MQTELMVFAAAILASAFGGMLGMAGGIFIVPLLVTLVDVDFQTAVGASLISVIACSCSSAAPLFTANLINIRLAVVLEVATTAGALTGVLLIGRIPVDLLYLLFSLILVASAVQMYQRRKVTVLTDDVRAGWGSSLQLDGTYTERPGGAAVAYRVERLPAGMSLMYVAGLVSALLGIGSGVLKIPAMDAALRLPLKVSSATSNFMIGVTATASASALLIRGDIDPTIAGPAALGSVLGAVAGARILMRLSGNRARLLFVVVLLALAVQMLLTALHYS